MQEQITRLLNLQPDKKIQNYAFSMNAVIGRGSYGIVYVGRQLDTGQPVALKVVSTTQVQSETLNIIQKEADIMKDLDSLNVVKLIDVLRTGNNYYIISELCTGGDLKEYMKRSGALEEQIALPIITQILRGILQSFKRGIIHRDLKPANILLHHQASYQVLFKIADFGFAKRFQHLENDLMTSLVGTPLYMSPQVLLRRQYTAKCDIWSVGLIYYELLEGRTPWNVRDILDLINKQKLTKITFSKRISRLSQQFILGCLQYEEQHRLSWEQIFTHPVFEGVFEKQQSTPPYVLSKKSSSGGTTEVGRQQTERTKAKTLTQKTSVSPALVAPLRVKTLSHCKTFVKSPNQTILKTHPHVSSLNEDRPTAKPQRNELQEYQSTKHIDQIQTEFFQTENLTTQLSAFQKDRNASMVRTTNTTQQTTKHNSEVKHFGSITNINRTANVSFTTFEKVQFEKKNTLQLDTRKENDENDHRSQHSSYQHNLIQNYLSEEFNQNKATVQINIDYLRYLEQLQTMMNELFHHRTSPVIVKFQFVLAKHAMIKSSEMKVHMIDQKINCFDLKEFKKFQQNDAYQKLEKQIVETHYEIFNHLQENFLKINENLNLIISDQDFLDVFNNQLVPDTHFAQYAFFLSFQFIRENIQNIVHDSNSQSLLKFSHAILLYCEHMRSHQYSQVDINSVLATLQAHNSGFFSKYEQANIPGLRQEIVMLSNKLSCYYERKP